MAAELPPPAEAADDGARVPTPAQRRADWTLVQLSGRLQESTFAGRLVTSWTGQWVALNQRGEIYLHGAWADCWESAKYWVTRQPPRGAAEDEDGIGSRRPLAGADDDAGGLMPPGA